MEITLVVAAAGTARGEVAGGAAAACRGEVAGGAAAAYRSEVAGGACWHALCQAKETTLVVAATASYRYTYGRSRRQATAILRAGAAAAGCRHTGGCQNI